MNPILQAYGPRIALFLSIAATLSGCQQTVPVADTSKQYPGQGARVTYYCPNATTLDVTHLQGGGVLVIVDGRSIQLARDRAAAGAERYTNRVQTLTLHGENATFEHLGQLRYGPCSTEQEGRKHRRGRDGS